MIYLFMMQATALPPPATLATPNYVETPSLNGRLMDKAVNSSKESSPNKVTILSGDLQRPTQVSRDSIQSFFQVEKNHLIMADEARKQNANSFLDLPTKVYQSGCSLRVTHPTGVKRVEDELLNGSFFLWRCPGFWIEMSILNMSYKTSPAMSVTLSDDAKLRNGGLESTSFAVNEEGKIRQQGSFAKNPWLVTYTAQSDGLVSQNYAKSTINDLIDSIILNPPLVKPIVKK